ncbi:hypothetical protein [Miltoncostaea oceani]|uniref:hypothetical protein n=1 Tax=Miltoncostaea oceani TaxID=2843216 RepID=UPI001C3CFBE9|nr:hypothetical protein [Miltoncostaea oceani]
MLLLSATSALAIPVQRVTVTSEPKLRVAVSTVLLSPAAADECLIAYQIQIRSGDGNDFIYKSARGKARACPGPGRTGVERVKVTRRFYMGNVEPQGRYRICVTARQRVAGRISSDQVCRLREIRRTF